jgi:putative Holliday junction resolvase
MLGLDVGTRRIGVAVSDGRLAVPLTIVEHKNRAADIERVRVIAQQQQAEAIVVGVPLDAAGGETEQSRLTRRFGDELALSIDMPVVYHDESFSTVATIAPPEIAGGRRKSRGKPRLDDLAAAVILQSYLDARGRGA